MNWFDILKNQVNIAGLNMRTMDLDNIIEEEDDDCMERLIQFCDNLEALPEGYLYGVWDSDDFKKYYDGPDKEICEFLDELKNIKDKPLPPMSKSEFGPMYSNILKYEKTMEAGCYVYCNKDESISEFTVYIYTKPGSIHGIFVSFEIRKNHPKYEASNEEKYRYFVKEIERLVP